MKKDCSVSIIIPFFKKMKEFQAVFPHNYRTILKTKTRIEVVISIDENKSEASLLEFIQHHPAIDYKVIINDTDHKWRNPCKAINVGIKHASMANCLVISPESLMDEDLIKSMLVHKDEDNYVIGRLKHSTIKDGSFIQRIKHTGKHYGSILFSKAHAERITGYNEHFYFWGAEDDDFRERLLRSGVERIEIDSGITHYKIHGKHDGVKRTSINSALLIRGPLKSNRVWGEDFNRKIVIRKKSSLATNNQRLYQ